MFLHFKNVQLFRYYPFHQSHAMDIADRHDDILAHGFDQHGKLLDAIYLKVR